MSDTQSNERNYFVLNNELNVPDKDGNVQLHKDTDAVKDFFETEVYPNLITFGTVEEQIAYMVNNDYYEEEFLQKYDMETIDEVFKIAESSGFQFRSFMGAYKFYRQYAVKTRDDKRYLEMYTDRVAVNALYLANGDADLAKNLADVMIKQEYQPATPTFQNAGRSQRGEFTSCFLIEVADDLNSIGRAVNSSLQLSKIGGGVALHLSNLRASGDPIKKIDNRSSGVMPVMKLLEDSFTYANQLGARQGSGAVYLNVFHPDIHRFLDTKKENADEKIRVKTLSLGVIFPDKFFELANNNEPMYLFSPYDVERLYGVPFSQINITEKYDELVENPEIRKKQIDARDLEHTISELQQESGYPYAFFEDNVNEQNPLKEKITFSNLCTEILQPSSPALLADDQTYIDYGRDISCNLGSVNIANLMQSDNFGDSVETMHRALTFVADTFTIDTVPSIRIGNEKARAIGLGAMNLHGFLAKNHIEYGSEESIEFVSTFFMMLNYYTLKASNKLAIERNETFDLFANSSYADGTYFEKYTSQDFAPKSDKVKELFEGLEIPGPVAWNDLKHSVQENGLYNQNRLATAPTGELYCPARV